MTKPNKENYLKKCFSIAEKRPPNTLYSLDEVISNDKDIK